MRTLIQKEFERFLDDDDGQPIVMLNLLRFQPDGGKECYAAYLEAVSPVLMRHGGEVVYIGDGLPALSAEVGQAWDAVALVRYPNRKAFASMAQDPDYRDKAGPLREASLSEAVLQPLRTAN